MKKATNIITIIFFITGLLYIFLGYCELSIVRHVVKGSLIPLLIVIFIMHFSKNLKGSNLLVLAGLVFSWAGDVVLDFAFLPGLACFLMAQMMYLLAFSLTPGRNIFYSRKIFFLAPVLIYGAALIYILYDDLGDLRLPVLIYASAILLMLSSAVNRFYKVNRQSYLLVLAGAALFVISDSAIAINKFSWNFRFSGAVIMSTYLIAQYLIITGYIRQFQVKSA
jgi:uncharacterized membrane protein YhhN